jgi:hypothetical protein
MKKKKRYVPVDGAHISTAEAKKVGLAVDRLISKLGRLPTTAEFAVASRIKTSPAYPVVFKRFRQLTASAWENAAAYCIRSVDIVWIDGAGRQSLPEKAFFVLSLIEEARIDDENGHATIYPVEDAQKSPAAIAAQELAMRRTVMAAVGDFASLAGFAKARAAAIRAIDDLGGRGGRAD